MSTLYIRDSPAQDMKAVLDINKGKISFQLLTFLKELLPINRSLKLPRLIIQTHFFALNM